jgi:membrane protease subunit (stomatin/prohibitin family)
MGTNNIIFLEVLEWFDSTGREMVHRIPEQGSGEIKFGAQLFVRDSQAAVFFYQGRAYDAMGPGRHTLKTSNIPVLNKILAIPWGLTSPLRAEVYFVNMKTFADLKWGTRDPVAFKDSELGLIRLRAFGVFNIRVVQPVLFVNRLVGTQGMYSTNDIEEYLNRVIVSRFNDLLGEKLDTIFNLPGRYNELADGLQKRLAEDFSHFGMALTHLYINAITPPQEVQKAIDDKSRVNVFDDLDKLIKMKAAMAVEGAATAEGAAGSGLGMGMGFMMPAMYAEYVKSGAAGKQGLESMACPDCKQPVGVDAKFCPSCGHQLLVFQQCGQCGKNLPPGAKFCSRCGTAVSQSPAKKVCSHCKTENLPESVFCNQCGEKMA